MQMEMEQGDIDRVFGELSRSVARDAMDVWFSTSQDVLARADSEESDTDLYPIMQSAQPPQWNSDYGRYEFSYTHLATVFHEYGAEAHIIKARRAEFLAFEWPDAPTWVQEQFSETFPLVFFKEVEHPGVPERRFIRAGRDEAMAHLEGRIDVDDAFGGVFG